MKISIVTSEHSSGWEWRIDPAEAEKCFRSMRGTLGVTRLWHGIETPDGMTEDEINDWIDAVYWDNGPDQTLTVWGAPAREHKGL